MKVVISATAKADLVEIGDFIAVDSRQRAQTFVDELVACCRQLATMPRAFPLVPHLKAAGLRRRPYRDYVILYRIEDETVQVLRVLHGARRHDWLLFPE